MKVIFLDIDGVLVTEVFITACYEISSNLYNVDYNKIMRDDYGMKFDPLACRVLEHIIKETDAKIVISSTWRMSGIIGIQEMWEYRKMFGEIIDITPNFMYKTGSTLQRGAEIKEWLNHHPEVTNYCIIDDDSDMLDEQINNFVQVHPMYGLTFKDDYEKVLNILK